MLELGLGTVEWTHRSRCSKPGHRTRVHMKKHKMCDADVPSDTIGHLTEGRLDEQLSQQHQVLNNNDGSPQVVAYVPASVCTARARNVSVAKHIVRWRVFKIACSAHLSSIDDDSSPSSTSSSNAAAEVNPIMNELDITATNVMVCITPPQAPMSVQTEIEGR